MITQNQRIVPVILCGGAGKRLWPLSREDTPKQFLKLGGDTSLLIDTVHRAMTCGHAAAEDVVIVTLDPLKHKTLQELAGYDPAVTGHVLCEPVARNTAAAIAYAAAYVNETMGRDCILWVLPADHYVGAPARLADAVSDAAILALEGKIITFGIQPDRPETGYGYIRTGMPHDGSNRIFSIDRFLEKPNREMAEKLSSDGRHVWNSGMFLMTPESALHAFHTYAPHYAPLLSQGNARAIPPDLYASLPSEPFDKAVMEKIDNGMVVICDMAWSDVGSWEGLWHLRQKDARGNAVSGRAAVVESHNCLIEASSLLVATIGLQDVAIVETGDTVLVADKKNPDAMRTLVAALEKVGAKETRRSHSESRPWGSFRILSESPGYKVKEITVTPGQRTSLQYHQQRCEFWTVVRGQARITHGDKELDASAQDNFFIPIGMKHRLENNGTDDLVIVEVQCGIYLEEDDIVRCADDYGREAA